ncbi:hypothetical protein ACIA0Z_07890 [Micrococcus luteus]|uniref:hypothetical protein n=1 Tax=Micrococcus luteus TaxID=1270 RepID=UPI0035DED534
MADVPLDWIPDHQIRALALLARAEELNADVARLLADYQLQPGGGLTLGHREVNGCIETVIAGIAPLPLALPLVAGEAMVALRGTMEHALYAEIIRQDGPLSEDAARTVDLPACSTPSDFEVWKRKKQRKGPPSFTARDSQIISRIHHLQPFHLAGEEALHPLARLVSYTNLVKHRSPAVTAVRVPSIRAIDRQGDGTEIFPPRGQGPLRIGERLSIVLQGETPEISMDVEVGINLPGTDRWPSLAGELSELSEWVRTQALPHIILGERRPPSEIPVHFDIHIGHRDPRVALKRGTYRSKLHDLADQFNAPVARRYLVDLIHSESSGFPPEMLSAWAIGLSDREAVSRASVFQELRHLPHEEIYRQGKRFIAQWVDEINQAVERHELDG